VIAATFFRRLISGLLAASPLLAQTPSSRQNSSSPAVHQAVMAERYGKPYVMVAVNGHGPYRFIVDTGTGADAFVTPELADILALPAVGQTGLSDPSGQGSRRTTLVEIETLQFAGLTFSHVKALRHTILAEAGGCDGILGFTLFRDYLLTLDFPKHLLLLETGALAADGEKTVLPFRMPDGVPIARLKIDGLPPFEAQLDSGGGGLVLPEAMAKSLKYDVDPVVYAEGRSVSTRFQLKAARLGSDVRIGRYTLTHPVVAIHPAFPLANFGSPPMRNFAITFDQKNLLVRFAARENHFRLDAPPAPTSLNFQPIAHPGDLSLVPIG
jgi:hypothetical protein